MIETERLVLRGWSADDRDDFWRLGADPAVMEHLPALDRAGSDALIGRLQALQDSHGHTFWAVERKEDGRVLGFCGVIPPREPLSETEIGWRLARDAWGRGYAREAAQASLAWAWANLPGDSVVAITTPGNARSQALMVRLGMERAPGEDFDHPSLPEGHPLRPHVLFRIHRP